VRDGVIDARLNTGADNLGFGHVNQRRVNLKTGRSFSTRLCRQSREPFKRIQEFRTAVRVAGVIDGVDADKNILRPDNLAPAKRKTEKNSVARRNVGNGNFFGHPVARPSLGDFNIRRKRRTAENPQVDRGDDMIPDAQGDRDAPGSVKFATVSLTVIKTERINIEALFHSQRDCRRGIKSAAR